ncbi:MAG TPA: aminotransferase class IV [Hanamia sp.]
MNELFFIYNGRFFRVGDPVISAGNRSLRYGDGLFETMRMHNGKIINVDFHFERLFSGMKILQIEAPKLFSKEFLLTTVNGLLRKNSHLENARIRLMVFRNGSGGIFDSENNSPDYIIETYPLQEKIELNENGLTVNVFADAKKSCDQFSNLKSNNYLPSVMAGLFAQKNKLDDAIILNTFGRVCESAIANIFIIKDTIYTPPLSEGCVAGVMRRWMLEKISLKNYIVIEKNLSIDDLLEADEFFLTNSIHPVRWVGIFREKIYGNERVKEIFEYVLKNI